MIKTLGRGLALVMLLCALGVSGTFSLHAQVTKSLLAYTGAYSSGVAYAKSDVVSESNLLYMSLTGTGNTGHDPATSPSWWQPLFNPSAAFSLTTTGTSGAATLSGGVLNIPQYAGAVSSLTTTGTSGAATLIGGVLNIPQYSGGGTSYTFSAPLVNTSGTVSLTFGTTSGTAAQGNDARITGACQTTGCAFTGSPTVPTPTTGAQAAPKSYVDAVAAAPNMAYQGAYASGTTYALNDVVIYSGTGYLSLQAANTGHQPDISGTWWSSLGSGGSSTLVYASTLSTTACSGGVAPGSSSTGCADNQSVLQSALNGGNKTVVIDGKYAIKGSLVVSSGTTLRCTAGNGLIQLAASDAPMLVNANPSSPTTADGVGGYVVSNLVDHDIVIEGCILNQNSTQSVTNPDHKHDPSGLWIDAIRMLGVQHLTLTRNLIYDSATYNVAVDNVDSVLFSNNTVQQPVPIAIKNTDGFHINGPATNIEIASNVIGPIGDDGVALNADDGYKTGTGDANGPSVAYPGWKWGTIDNVSIHDNRFLGPEAGFRLLSNASRIDHISAHHNYGYTTEQVMQIGHANYPGTSNIGVVDIDGIDIRRGTGTAFGVPGWIYLQAPIESLNIANAVMQTAQTTDSYLYIDTGVTPKAVSVSNFTIDNATGTNVPVILRTNSAPTNYRVSGVNWLDTGAATGRLFGGSVTPSAISFSNYAGLKCFLATGYAPAQYGDGWTSGGACAASGGGTTYLNTTFNEGAAGTNLAGTTPATFTGTGTWTQFAGTSPTFVSGGGVLNSGNSGTTPSLLDLTHANLTLHITFAAFPTGGAGGAGVVMRFTDANNFVVANLYANRTDIYDVTAGTATLLGTISGAPVAGTSMTFTLSGSSITANDGVNAPVTVTLPGGTANATATKFGFEQFTAGQTLTVSAMSATP